MDSVSGSPEHGYPWLVEQLILNAAGLVCIGCGLILLSAARSTTRTFGVLFCIFYGLHWGGPLDFLPAHFYGIAMVAYLVVSGTLAQTFLLDFTLALTGIVRRWTALLFGPAVTAAILGLIATVAYGEDAVSTLPGSLFLLLTMSIDYAYPLAALCIVIVASIRAPRRSVQRRRFQILLLGFCFSFGFYAIQLLLISLLGASSELAQVLNMAFVALPIAVLACARHLVE